MSKQQLNPKVKQLVDQYYAMDIEEPEYIERHRELWRTTLRSLGRKCPAVETRDISFQGRDQTTIGMRIYTPPGEGPHPLLIYYPGGAFVYGDLEGYDPHCRAFALESNYVVTNVGIARVAPEAPFPHGLHDAYDALLWCIDNAKDLNINPDSIVISGDSSGGNFAALVALEAYTQGLTNISAQILMVPATDLARTGESHQTYDQGYLLDRVDWFYAKYIPENIAANDPRMSPLYAELHSSLPPAYILVAECDPLCDDGIMYHKKLQAAGVQSHLTVYPGAIHSLMLFREQIADPNIDPQAHFIEILKKLKQ